MTPITPSLLAELKAKAEGATPEWSATYFQGWEYDKFNKIITPDGNTLRLEGVSLSSGKEARANSEYISIASPTTILALIARVKELEERESHVNRGLRVVQNTALTSYRDAIEIAAQLLPKVKDSAP